MSWLSHAFKRILHYANPVTAVKAQVHQVERAAHFTERSVQQQVRALEGAGHFVERQAKKDYIKFNRITAYIAPVVTPILAFIGELVPVIGIVLGPILSGLGALLARFSDSVALRSQGVTGLHNRQMARGKERRTFQYGLYGSAAGGLASAAGLDPFSVSSPAVDTTQALAGEAGQVNDAAVGASAPPVTPVNAASGQPELAPGAVNEAGQPLSISSKGAGITAASTSTDAGTGILGTGITWGQIGNVVSPIISLVPNALKIFGIGVPKPSPAPGSQLSGGGAGGGGGSEGTGDTSGGPLGALAEDLAGLPLPVKLAAGALGLGVVAFAFTKGRKAA